MSIHQHPMRAQCARDRLCGCVIGRHGTVVRVERMQGEGTLQPGTTRFERNRVLHKEVKVRAFESEAWKQYKEDRRGNGESAVAEEVCHDLVLFACGDDSSPHFYEPVEKDDRIIYFGDEYEVHKVVKWRDEGMLIYSQAFCIRIEDE